MNKETKNIGFPLDYFGVVSSPLLQACINQSGDKRKRKVAFNNIERMLKSFALIPKEAKLVTFGLETDLAGQIGWTASFNVPIPKFANTADMIGTDAQGRPVAFDTRTHVACKHLGTMVSAEGHGNTDFVTCECGHIMTKTEAEANACIFT